MPVRFTTAAGWLPAIEQRPFSPAVVCRVDGKTESRITGFLHASEDFRTPVQTTANVELKDLWVVGARGDLFETGLGDRANEVHSAELRGGFRHGDAAFGSDRLQRTDRRHHHRNAQLLSEKRCRRVDL